MSRTRIFGLRRLSTEQEHTLTSADGGLLSFLEIHCDVWRAPDNCAFHRSPSDGKSDFISPPHTIPVAHTRRDTPMAIDDVLFGEEDARKRQKERGRVQSSTLSR